MTPRRKKMSLRGIFHVQRDCFETIANSRHQKLYSEGGKKFMGVISLSASKCGGKYISRKFYFHEKMEYSVIYCIKLLSKAKAFKQVIVLIDHYIYSHKLAYGTQYLTIIHRTGS